ncbi:alginate export family protein [Sphingomonas koreensis]|nr:alginate export family protein [Sphingomonas koreensis]
MRYKLAWVVAPIIVAAAPAHAQASDSKLSIDFNLRARLETIDGQFRPGISTSDTALLFRTGLAASYDAGPITIGGEVMDSRVYFEHKNSSVSTNEVNALEPIQAYITGKLSDTASLTGGRFTMDIGSRRLVARASFRNTTNAFTGGRFDWASKAGDSVTAFWTMPQARLPSDLPSLEDNDVKLDRERIGVQFFGASAIKAHVLGGTLQAYLYRLAEDDSPVEQTKNRHLWTPGMRLYRAPKTGQIDYEVEAAWQTGHTRSSTAITDTNDLDVSAGLVHASVGRSFAARWSPRISLAVDYASGDHAGGKYGRFDTLYGARVFEFGPSSFYGPVSRANLVSVEARVEVKPSKRWDGYIAVRPLWLDSATDSFASTSVRDAAGTAGSYAGTQFDMRARYWLVPKQLRLNAGFAMIAKGRFLTDAANAPADGDTHYGFVEVQLSI